MSTYYLYILSNPRRTVLYIGVTNNLERRLEEHKSHTFPGFTARYNCIDLLYFEETSNVDDAILREKQLKKWSRSKKLILIKRLNPLLRDLSTSPCAKPVQGSGRDDSGRQGARLIREKSV